jgi:hypothetical protein
MLLSGHLLHQTLELQSVHMTVYKRAGSKYWWIRLERNGKVVQESSEKLTKREAKLVEAARRIEVWPELEGGKEMPTLVEFTRQLFPFWTRELKQRTAGYYKDAFAHLVDFDALAHARLDDINPRLIEQFKAHRQEHKAGVVNVNHSLRGLCTWRSSGNTSQRLRRSNCAKSPNAITSSAKKHFSSCLRSAGSLPSRLHRPFEFRKVPTVKRCKPCLQFYTIAESERVRHAR